MLKIALLLMLGASFAFAQSGHSVTLTWAPNSTGDPVTTYNVLRGLASQAEGTTPIGTVAAATCTTSCTYTDTTVIGGTTYFYELTATNSGGTSGPSPEVSFSVPLFAPATPAKPAISGH